MSIVFPILFLINNIKYMTFYSIDHFALLIAIQSHSFSTSNQKLVTLDFIFCKRKKLALNLIYVVSESRILATQVIFCKISYKMSRARCCYFNVVSITTFVGIYNVYLFYTSFDS